MSRKPLTRNPTARRTKRELLALAARINRAEEAVTKYLMQKFNLNESLARVRFLNAPRDVRDRWIAEAGIDPETGKKR